MSPQIPGIHHITAIASDPQQNVNFYVDVLGCAWSSGPSTSTIRALNIPTRRIESPLMPAVFGWEGGGHFH